MTMFYDRQGNVITREEAYKYWEGDTVEDFDRTRGVARTEWGEGEDRVMVSTVFLVINHQFGDGPPLIFESMVFGGPLDGEEDRYPTEEAALAGHDQIVAKAKAAESQGTSDG